MCYGSLCCKTAIREYDFESRVYEYVKNGINDV